MASVKQATVVVISAADIRLNNCVWVWGYMVMIESIVQD